MRLVLVVVRLEASTLEQVGIDVVLQVFSHPLVLRQTLSSLEWIYFHEKVY